MEQAPRIPRAEAVGPDAILNRVYDLQQEREHVNSDIDACLREFKERSDRLHEIDSEIERSMAKLVSLGVLAPGDL